MIFLLTKICTPLASKGKIKNGTGSRVDDHPEPPGTSNTTGFRPHFSIMIVKQVTVEFENEGKCD